MFFDKIVKKKSNSFQNEYTDKTSYGEKLKTDDDSQTFKISNIKHLALDNLNEFSLYIYILYMIVSGCSCHTFQAYSTD